MASDLPGEIRVCLCVCTIIMCIIGIDLIISQVSEARGANEMTVQGKYACFQRILVVCFCPVIVFSATSPVYHFLFFILCAHLQILAHEIMPNKGDIGTACVTHVSNTDAHLVSAQDTPKTNE